MPQFSLFTPPVTTAPPLSLRQCSAGMAEAHVRMSLAIRAADPSSPLTPEARLAWCARLEAMAPEGGVQLFTRAELEAMAPALVTWASAQDLRLGTQLREQFRLLRARHAEERPL
jgi:hypothetical protein